MNLDTVTSASEMGEQFNSSDDNNVIGPEHTEMLANGAGPDDLLSLYQSALSTITI